MWLRLAAAGLFALRHPPTFIGACIMRHCLTCRDGTRAPIFRSIEGTMILLGGRKFLDSLERRQCQVYLRRKALLNVFPHQQPRCRIVPTASRVLRYCRLWLRPQCRLGFESPYMIHHVRAGSVPLPTKQEYHQAPGDHRCSVTTAVKGY